MASIGSTRAAVRSLALCAVLATIGGGCGGGGGGAVPPPDPVPQDFDFSFGMVPEEDVSFDGLPTDDERLGTRPPARVDLTSSLPAVGNQGCQGSCVGWAVGYYTKTAQEKKEAAWSLSATNHLFSPAYLYNQRPGANLGDNGMEPTAAIQTVITRGCASLATMPYSDGDSTTPPSSAAHAEAGNYHATGQPVRFGSTFGVQGSDIDAMRTWLSEKQYPLVIGIPVFDSFMNFRGENGGVIYNMTGGAYHGGHALAVVGYDDAVGGGSFRIVNSWFLPTGRCVYNGGLWGSNGFAWIPYQEIMRIGTRAYGMVDGPNTGTPPPAPNPTDAGNDMRSGAGAILAGETRNGTVGNLRDDPADWYVFSATAGTRAHITLSGLTSDVDMKLTDASENRLASSTLASTAAESMDYTFPTTGNYYIKVYPWDDAVSPYSLTLTTQTGENNDTPGGATVLAKNSDAAGAVGGTDPRDWWKVTLSAGTPTTVTLTGLSADIDIYVYTAAAATGGGSPLGSSINAAAASETFTFSPGAAGDYYVLVVPWGTAQSTYTLRASQVSGSVELNADSFSLSYTLYSDRVTATVSALRVSNNGTADCGAYNVRMGLSLSNSPGSSYWYRTGASLWTSPGLQAGFYNTWSGGSETIYKSGITPSGSYYIVFHVDPTGLIPESNELNNYMYSSSRVVPIP